MSQSKEDICKNLKNVSQNTQIIPQDEEKG
jgi:hypothetical protein